MLTGRFRGCIIPVKACYQSSYHQKALEFLRRCAAERFHEEVKLAKSVLFLPLCTMQPEWRVTGLALFSLLEGDNSVAHRISAEVNVGA